MPRPSRYSAVRRRVSAHDEGKTFRPKKSRTDALPNVGKTARDAHDVRRHSLLGMRASRPHRTPDGDDIRRRAVPGDHPAAAPDRLFFIGDSLTDYGNLYGATRFLNGQNPLVPVLPPSPPYFAGRYSNGPTYAESLPGLLGVPDANVVSFAFAGAESGDTNAHRQASVLFNSLDIDALDQVGRAIASGAVGPDAIAVYTIGGTTI